MHTADIIDGIRTKKDELGLTNQQLSDASGVPKATVDRILSGRTDNPTLQNVLDLANAVGYEFHPRTAMPPAPVTASGGTEQITAIYEDRIKSYERLLARDQRHNNMLLAEKNRWLLLSLTVNIILVALICGLLIYDITHPDIGWVRSQLADFKQGNIFQYILSALQTLW